MSRPPNVGAPAEVGIKKEKFNILMASEHIILIGKLRDVQPGTGFGPSLVLTRLEEVCTPGCFLPTR